MPPITRGFAMCWMLVASALVTLAPPPSAAAPVLGFREDFSGAGVGLWGGGTPFANPGTGGVLGTGDGFLRVETTFDANWGLRCRDCPEYSGDWNAAGITQLRLWLNDVDADEPFEIHVSIGGDANLWQYDIGFLPPHGVWAEHVVDLTNSANFTQILGSGTLASALDNVTIVLIRHDKAPYLPNPAPPDPITGAAGIDRLLLTNGTVGVAPLPAGVRPSLELAPPYPNPSRGRVTFRVRQPGSGAVTMEILDLAGRGVRRQLLGAGERQWVWNGLDEGGRRVPPGRYRVRALGAEGGVSRPFVVLD